ncbi:MAG: hypothetical protein QXI12_10680 [Candidatus Methanomethyliaceae archaeon]
MSEKELRKKLAAYEEAAREAVRSSIPYLAAHDAFLISREAWAKLALLVDPKLSILEELFQKMKKGEKITEEDLRRL